MPRACGMVARLASWRGGAPADLFALAALGCLATALIQPLGDFPLNDDWSYGIAVRRLLEDGGYHPTGWTAVTLIAHVLWGALFCLGFGLSFTVLRFATLCASFLAIAAVYLLIRRLDRPRWLAILLSLTLACNPIYLTLSHTFMTDVTFIALMTWALLAYLISLQTGSTSSLMVATGLSVAAILCRQTGLFLAAAFGLAVLLTRGLSWRSAARASLPVLCGFAALAAFQCWMKSTGRVPDLYNAPTSTPLSTMLWELLSKPAVLAGKPILLAGRALLYLGLFLFPVLLAIPRHDGFGRFGRLAAASRWLPWVFCVGALAGLGATGRLMPVAKNVLTVWGTGPILLGNHFSPPPLPHSFWWVVTILSAAGGGLILGRLGALVAGLLAGTSALPSTRDKAAVVFGLCAAVTYLTPFLLTFYLDRYLLPLIPVLALTFAATPEKTRWSMRSPTVWAAVLMLGFTAVFSVASTHDYLGLNRARWNALRDLMTQQHVSPEEIDGGFEFEGLHFLGENIRWQRPEEARYMLASGNVPGFEQLHDYHFRRWLPPRAEHILVLRRVTAATEKTDGLPATESD